MMMWPYFIYPVMDKQTGKGDREERLRDIENRMTDFIRAKRGKACDDVISSIETARDHVRSETGNQRVAY